MSESTSHTVSRKVLITLNKVQICAHNDGEVAIDLD